MAELWKQGWVSAAEKVVKSEGGSGMSREGGTPRAVSVLMGEAVAMAVQRAGEARAQVGSLALNRPGKEVNRLVAKGDPKAKLQRLGIPAVCTSTHRT